VLSLYDALLLRRDDPVVRLNRIVAVAEVRGVESALLEFESLNAESLQDFAPYHAVRADLLRRTGRTRDAREAYDEALSRIASDAERRWLTRQRSLVLVPPC
jgi:RNA polymerase sigma-70 factor (ECF subfamily)